MTSQRHEMTILIRPEYLNHAGTIFGGYMMQWADEMAYNAATLAFPGCAFVTKLFGQFDFIHSTGAGEIIKIYSEVESRVRTSCRVRVWAVNAATGGEVFSTFGVMVNAPNGVKQPISPA